MGIHIPQLSRNLFPPLDEFSLLFRTYAWFGALLGAILRSDSLLFVKFCSAKNFTALVDGHNQEQDYLAFVCQGPCDKYVSCILCIYKGVVASKVQETSKAHSTALQSDNTTLSYHQKNTLQSSMSPPYPRINVQWPYRPAINQITKRTCCRTQHGGTAFCRSHVDDLQRAQPDFASRASTQIKGCPALVQRRLTICSRG